MKIAIVGAGNVGRLYGTRWVERGHEVTFGYVRDHARLDAFVAQLGPAASVADTAELTPGADLILFSPPFEQIDDAAGRIGPADGIPLIDTTNPFNPERTGLVDLGATTSAAKVAGLFPHARVVKAFHNLSVEQAADPAAATAPPVIFLAGDDEGAKNLAARLVIDAGLVPFDTGALSTAHLSEAPGPLFMNPCTVTNVNKAVCSRLA